MVFKRKKYGLTDYSKRLKLLKSGEKRFVVRVTNKGVIGQIIEYGENGDHVLLTVTDKSLENYGIKARGNNMQICYLVGYATGIEAHNRDIDYVVLDTGRFNFIPGGRIAACLKGIVDSGIDINHGEDIFPSNDRLEGKHLKNPIKLKDALKKFKKVEEKA